MRKNMSSIVLAVIGVSALSIALPMSIASAQQAGPARVAGSAPQDQQFAAPPPRQNRGQATAPGQPFPQQNPGIGMRQGGFGGATMVDDDQNLYILQGNRLFKVSKSDLKVLKESNLPMPQPLNGAGVDDRRIGGEGQ